LVGVELPPSRSGEGGEARPSGFLFEFTEGSREQIHALAGVSKQAQAALGHQRVEVLPGTV
jgi:hypothetical protein